MNAIDSGAAVAEHGPAIQALYQELMDGWNRGSAEAFAAAFAEDGVLIGFDGTRFDGRQAIVAFHQPLFDSHLKGSRLVGFKSVGEKKEDLFHQDYGNRFNGMRGAVLPTLSTWPG